MVGRDNIFEGYFIIVSREFHQVYSEQKLNNAH